MKKMRLIPLLLFAALFCAAPLCAQSVVVGPPVIGASGTSVIITAVLTADGSGNIPDKLLDPQALGIYHWYFIQARTSPSGPAPTNGYSIMIYDNSVPVFDLALTTLTSRSSTLTQRVSIANATIAYPVIDGPITLHSADNHVAGAVVTLELFFRLN